MRDKNNYLCWPRARADADAAFSDAEKVREAKTI